jgi:hypothetical protein
VIAALFITFVLNLSIIVGFPSPTIFYMTNVGLHLALGTAVVVVVARKNVFAGLSLLTGVVISWMARTGILQRKYKEAVDTFKRVLAVDPADLQAHYNLMLACRGLGDNDNAVRAEKLFRRFKTDESSQSITARPRMLSVEDNNERQMIHDHESAFTERVKR